jgi:ADP-ribose pyrophosphatase
VTILPWTVLAREPLIHARVFVLDKLRVRSPRTGGEHDFFVLGGPDWCNVIPLTPEGEVVMIRQYRHGTREITLEVPGGLVDPEDASPLDAARRELEEETGYAAECVEPLGVIHPNPAIQEHRCHSFVARGARRVGAQRLEEREDIEVVHVPLAELPGRIASGEITHALTVVAFAWLLGVGGRSPR